MAKRKDKIRISFIGNNADNVAGSMTLIETEEKNILLECGMIQSSNSIYDYKENSKSFPFKPKNIDYVFLGHVHIDHSGRIPKLIKEGFDGKIITTSITGKLLKPMLLDCCNIIGKDAEYISRKRDKEVEPYYNDKDVAKTLNHVYEYDYGIKYDLDENISFRLLRNSHIVGACQIELFIQTSSGHVEKILYTSDLGGVKNKNHYVDDTEFCTKANVVISECTYGGAERNVNGDRAKDMNKIKDTVHQVCEVAGGRLLIPVFSLGKCQQILTDLYMLFGEDQHFKIPIVCDSPLIWEVTKTYREFLTGEHKDLFDKVTNWKNVRFIKDFKESKNNVCDSSPKIILSSSGFLHKGRSVFYLQKYLENVKDHILFVGYAPPGSIAYKIRSGQKTITIDGKMFKNRCGISVLNSFSSHIGQEELLKFLKGIQCNKICLVHGEQANKIEFKALLESELSAMCKTTKVICTNKGTSFSI